MGCSPADICSCLLPNSGCSVATENDWALGADLGWAADWDSGRSGGSPVVLGSNASWAQAGARGRPSSRATRELEEMERGFIEP